MCYARETKRSRARPSPPTRKAERPPESAGIPSRRRAEWPPTGRRGRIAQSSIEPSREQIEHNENSVADVLALGQGVGGVFDGDRKSTRLNSSHLVISYAVFCLKKKKKKKEASI